MNICGCLVHVAKGQRSSARAAMEATAGVEIHAASDDGRFVVVVEDTATARASEIIMALHQISGVISLTLTFHHFEEAAQDRKPPFAHAQQPAGGQSHDHL
jgi:nitrate reductase NapD